MINKHRLTWILVSIFVVAACSSENDRASGETKAEFEVLCDEFTTLAQSSDFAQLLPEVRAEQLELMLVNKLYLTDHAYMAWTAIRNATPSERYSLYREAAASSGYQEWSCPAMAEHGHKVGSSHD